MNTKLLLVAAAAAFATASCSQEKKTETTETTTVPGGEQTTTTTVDTAAYRTSADALANQVAADLKASDAAIKTRLQNAYYTRGRALRDLDTRYATDTIGRYAALKALNDQTTSEVKTIVDPAQYKSYTASQGTYYEGPYTATVVTTTTTKPSLGARVGQGSGIKKLENDDDDRKVKYNNGAKIKRSDDGSLKIKRADGTKIKIDENGNRTVKKGLF